MELGQAGWILVFLVAAGAVVAAGIALAGAGDAIAEETGLSRMTVGLVMLALATSLPEIATDVSAALAGAPDLAVGDLFGSSMANMAILALVDLGARRRIFPAAELRQSRLATGAITLTAVAVLGALVPSPAVIGWVGIDTILIGAGYLALLLWLRGAPVDLREVAGNSADAAPPRRETEMAAPSARRWPSVPPPAGPTSPGAPAVAATRDRRRLRRAIIVFTAATVGVVVAAPALAVSAKELAVLTGVGETIIGTALLAVATSLPELAASVAAVRIGAVDLAVGNLFGSNAFNMSILLFVDIAYTPGPLLDATSPADLVPGVGAILLTTLGLAAVLHGRAARAWRAEPDALLILAAYGAILLTMLGLPR